MKTFVAWIFSPAHSANAGACKAIAMLLVVLVPVAGIVSVSTRGDTATPSPPDRARRPGLLPDAGPPSPTSVEWTAPAQSGDDRELGRVMDDAGARHHLARLKMAAASGDEAGRASAIRSLTRYGSGVKPLLNEALFNEADPTVRHYLAEARNALK